MALVLLFEKVDACSPIIDNIVSKFPFPVHKIFLNKEFPETENIKQIRSKLIEKIKLLNGKVVLTYGEKALYSITNHKSISNSFLQPIKEDSFIVIPSYKPLYFLNTKNNKFYLESGLRLAYNLIIQPKLDFPEICSLETEEDFLQAQENLRGQVVGLDFETSGLDIFSRDFKILSLALATKDKVWYVRFDGSVRLMMLVESLLRCGIKSFIVHNYLFDGVILKVFFGMNEVPFEDTLLISYLIDENRPQNLKFLASIYLNYVYEFTFKDLKEGLFEDYEENLKRYNSTDAYITLRLFDELYPQLTEKQKSFYNILKKRFVPVVLDLIVNGFPVDVDYVVRLKEEFKARKEELIKKLNQYSSLRLARKIAYYVENMKNKEEFLKTGEIPVNEDELIHEIELEPTKATHVLAILKALNCIPQNEKTESGRISLNENVLNKIDKEEIKLLLEIKKLQKLHSTYLEGLIKHIMPDNRIHSSYSLTSTVTGRLASSNPNLQNIPANEEIKNIFAAPQGYLLLQYDWSQIELRVAAALSRENAMLKLFKEEGHDFHKANASRFLTSLSMKLLKKKEDWLKRLVLVSCMAYLLKVYLLK